MTAMTETKNVVKFVWTHPANKGRRAQAVARAVRFQARSRLLHRRTLARLGERSYLWAGLHRPGASRVVYGNPPDHPEMLVWRRSLIPGDVFVDVGANVGSYTIWAGELGAEVIALEPAADTFELLLENISINDYQVTAMRASAGSACGMTRFTVGQDCINRLDPQGSAGVPTVQVEMVTIDSIIGDRFVKGMKVDVEGFEIEVLRGCKRALSEQRIGLIQLEWNPTCEDALGTDRQPTADLLAEFGYKLYRPGCDGVLNPIDEIDYGPDVFARPLS
jgi:FkbM family methyltransferase